MAPYGASTKTAWCGSNEELRIKNEEFVNTEFHVIPTEVEGSLDKLEMTHKKGGLLQARLYSSFFILNSSLNKRNRFRIFDNHRFLRPVRIGFNLEIVLTFCRIVHHRKFYLLIRIQ